MFELEAKQPWEARESVDLEANELTKQVTDGPEIYLASG